MYAIHQFRLPLYFQKIWTLSQWQIFPIQIWFHISLVERSVTSDERVVEAAIMCHLFAFKTNKCHHFTRLYDMNFNIAVATTLYNIHSGCSVTFMLKSWFLTLMEILLPFIAISIIYCYSFPVVMQLLLMAGWILRCALTS